MTTIRNYAKPHVQPPLIIAELTGLAAHIEQDPAAWEAMRKAMKSKAEINSAVRNLLDGLESIGYSISEESTGADVATAVRACAADLEQDSDRADFLHVETIREAAGSLMHLTTGKRVTSQGLKFYGDTPEFSKAAMAARADTRRGGRSATPAPIIHRWNERDYRPGEPERMAAANENMQFAHLKEDVAIALHRGAAGFLTALPLLIRAEDSIPWKACAISMQRAHMAMRNGRLSPADCTQILDAYDQHLKADIKAAFALLMQKATTKVGDLTRAYKNVADSLEGRLTVSAIEDTEGFVRTLQRHLAALQSIAKQSG